MRIVLFALLVPLTTALECVIGGSTDNSGDFSTVKCAAEAQFCYTMNLTQGGVHTIAKNCDLGFLCQNVGVFDQQGGTIFCCKGDDCNSDADDNPKPPKLECVMGGSTNDIGTFTPLLCPGDEQYCYAMDVTLDGVHTITKGCDPGLLCQGVGVFEQRGGTINCCIGNDCNSDGNDNPKPPKLECSIGGSVDGKGAFSTIQCEADTQYCYTMDFSLDGVHSRTKDCDPGNFCQGVGAFDKDGGTIFCCKGDDCNFDKNDIPVPDALECISGGTVNDIGSFAALPCSKSEQYCYTMDVTQQGVHTVTKGCDPGFLCQVPGIVDQPGGYINCCKSDDCNSDTNDNPKSPKLECFIGGSVNDIGTSASFLCSGDEQYCYTMDVTLDGVHTITKACDPGFLCKGVGVFDQQGGTIYCCNGFDCNSGTHDNPKPKLDCIMGTSVDDIGEFTPLPCYSTEQYCFTTDNTLDGVHTVTKGCDRFLCQSPGMFEQPGGTLYCCTDNDCNVDQKPDPKSTTSTKTSDVPDKPTVPELECIVGGSTNDNGTFTTLPCFSGAQFCYTMDVTIEDVHTVVKDCDLGFLCQNPGTVIQTGGTLYCCKGNDCNSASGISLIMTVLAAVAAVLQWL